MSVLRLRMRRATLLLVGTLCGMPPLAPIDAQSIADLAARDAFLVSAPAALPPVILSSASSQVSLRYAGWFSSLNGDLHSNVGVTFSKPAFKGTGIVGVTGAYVGAACDGCDGWLT